MFDFIVNKIYPKFLYFLYKIGFSKIGRNSIIFFPRLKVTKKNMYIGKNTIINKYARIETYKNNTNNNPKIIIGDNVGIHYGVSILAGDDIIIGNNVLIASNVFISSENHSINPEDDNSYVLQELEVQKVIIENGVWIGEKVCILPGVTIGKKSIIGAASVVTKSIPEYSIAVGNPAKVIKKYNFNKHEWENALEKL